jgi:hypothetical protein
MKINGDWNVLIGTAIIWLTALGWFQDALVSFQAGDNLWAAFRLLGSLGALSIGWRVARTEG